MSWGKFIATVGLFGAYEKKEGNDRLLLLFLFNFISYVEIDGYTYFRNENPHPV